MSKTELAEMAHRMLSLGRTLGEIETDEIEIARTPKAEIWRSGKTRLFRYDEIRRRRLGPLLICHGLVGRQSMTDLEPERSVVRRLLEAGVDVWVVDWGSAGRADRLLDTTHFADRMLGEALDRVAAETGAGPILLGICQGGTFSLIQAAHHPGRMAGLALAIAPVDFHADKGDPDTPPDGFLNLWLRSLPADLVTDMIEEFGNLPGQLIGAVFQNLTPARTLAKYTSGLLDLAEDRERLTTFLRMERWLADRPDHPGAAAKEWLIGLYRENRLVEGRFEIDGRPVRLGEVACPVLNIYGTRDHIVPPGCSRALMAHLPKGADYQELAIPSGHVGVFVSKKALDILPGALIGWLARIAE